MGTTNPQHHQSVAFLMLAAFFWSSGGLLIKSIQWNPMAIAATRSGIAALLLLIVLRKPHFIWTKAQWGSAFGYAGTVLLFVSATKLTTAANAIFLQYTAPIYVALLSPWLLGEKISKIDWVTIGVVLAGMALFFVERLSTEHTLGNLLAIASGIAFATMVLGLRKQGPASTQESVLLGNVLAFIFGIPFLIQGGGPSGVQDFWLLLVLGVVQLGIPYLLYARAIRHVTAMEGILIPMFEPILNPIWVILFVGEKPSWNSVAGGLIVIAAITSRQILRSCYR
jgi:drug/metabolite transporter (DMT)-like permease